MDLSRSEYPALLQSLQPAQAVVLLEDRVKLIGKINSDIADWLSERRRVEDAYVQGLRKLVSRRSQDITPELGIFRTPWQTIVSSTESLAQSHSILSQKIEVDVERPLREFQVKSKEMQAMSTMQGNMISMAREFDTAQKRADKARSGKSSAVKVANATADVDYSSQQWQSQAPYVFEQLQALDENRTNHLRDVLTQLQTHEVDLVERNRATAESCLNALLNVDTADEISTFVVRSTTGRPSVPPRIPSRSTTTNHLRPTTPGRSQDDNASEISGASAGMFRSSTSPVIEQKRFGFKRLGTVMGRRRQNSKSSGQPLSPEKRPKPPRNPLRRGISSKDMEPIPSPGASAVNLASSSPLAELNPSKSKTSPATGGSTVNTVQQNGNDHSNSNTHLLTPTRSMSMPITNGNSSYIDQTMFRTEQPAGLSEKPVEAQHSNDAGFSVPPPPNDDISHVQQEAAATEPEPQFKLDIRDEPIQEEDGDAQSALSNVANTLREKAQQVATPRKPTANRGRRDVRNTVFVPSPPVPDLPNSGDSPMPSASPFAASRSNTLASDLPQNSDVHSIRSSHSITNLPNLAAKHPDMHQSGLNASIIETVSADFSQGQVTRATVVGELALVHNPSQPPSSPGPDSIRLENFPVLEKVAPNPAFITELPSQPGEYSVDLAQISRTAIAFKYKVHLEEPFLAAHAPISLTSTWKIEPRQASVILSYAFNPSFVSPAQRRVTLANLVVLITIDHAKALACKSKPVGTFSKDKSMIYWKLGDVTVDAYAEAPIKLVARFATETEARPGSVEARWEIGGEHADTLGSGLGLSQLLASKGSDTGGNPFADDTSAGGAGASAAKSWKEVAVVRKIVSGRYTATAPAPVTAPVTATAPAT